MTSYAVKRTIAAAPETIWALLTDAPGYASWNPAVIGIDGRIAPGEKIKLTSVVNPKRAFSLTVTEFDEPRHMVWSDGMPLGLFKGVRTYTLTQQTGGGVEFAMREVYSGLVAPMITRSIPDLQPAFDEFAAALKKRAEGAA